MYDVASALVAGIAEHEAFYERISKMPPAEAEKAKEARRKQIELDAQRRHELELAKASRPKSSPLGFLVGLFIGSQM